MGDIQSRCYSFRGDEKKELTEFGERQKNERLVSREDRIYTKCHIPGRHENRRSLSSRISVLVKRHKFLLLPLIYGFRLQLPAN